MELDQHPKTTYPEHLQDDSDFFTWRVVFEGPSDSLPVLGTMSAFSVQKSMSLSGVGLRFGQSRLQGFKA